MRIVIISIIFWMIDKTLMSEEDQKAVEEIQATVSSVMSEYENAKGTEKISSDKKDELVAFKEKLRTDITALYDKYPDVEFYNKDKIPEILDEMDTCIVKSNFIGLKAYGNLIKDTRFWKALGHTLIFTVISVGIELVLGMLLALIMNKAMKGIGLVRTVALIPWAIPTAVSAMIWSYLYDGSYGIVSFLFNKLGIINSQSAMLLTSHGAMSAAIIADVWKTTPYMALLLLAGLQVIDRGLYESSAIDGAGPVVTFFKITLPLVKPSLLVALLFRTLDAFRVYDLIAILTGGGPGNGTESLSIYAYKLRFDQSNYGYSSVSCYGNVCCSSNYLHPVCEKYLGQMYGKRLRREKGWKNVSTFKVSSMDFYYCFLLFSVFPSLVLVTSFKLK